jgi:hypothetical protein
MIGASKATSTRAYQLLGTTTITSTGAQSYTIIAGTVYVEVEMWGAGGGGGRGNVVSGRGGTTHHAAGGGGGGAYVKHQVRIADLRLSDTLNFTVGAGGAGDTNSNQGGVAGGDTSIDTHKRSTTTITSFSSITAGGAEGGQSQGLWAGATYNGDAGVATNGNITNTNGTDGGARPSSSGSNTAGAAGGAGANGGAGGAAGSTSVQISSMDGAVPGGGGGGGASNDNKNGGAGANGKVIVRVYG